MQKQLHAFVHWFSNWGQAPKRGRVLQILKSRFLFVVTHSISFWKCFSVIYRYLKLGKVFC